MHFCDKPKGFADENDIFHSQTQAAPANRLLYRISEQVVAGYKAEIYTISRWKTGCAANGTFEYSGWQIASGHVIADWVNISVTIKELNDQG